MIIDTSTLTDGAELAKSMKDTITEESFQEDDISKYHDVVENVKASKEVPVMGLMTGPMGKIKADCDTTPNALVSIGTTKKTWSPAYISDRIELCYSEFETSFMKWLLGKGIKREDITGTDIANFLVQRTEELLKKTIFEKAYFTDTAAAAGVDNGLSAGQLPYFTPMDGLFKKLFAISNPGAGAYVEIPNNTAGPTNDDQAFTDADTNNYLITKIMDRIYRKADIRLRGKSNLVWRVTQSAFDQFVAERKNPILESAYRRTETGITGLSHTGIPVVPVHVWDRTLAEYFQVDNGGGDINTFLPHRILLTTTDTLKLGTESIQNLSELDIFYDKYHKKFVIDFGFLFDSQVALDYLVAMGY